MTQVEPIYGVQSLLARLKSSNILLTATKYSGAAIIVEPKSILARMDPSLEFLEASDIQAASVKGVQLRLLFECLQSSAKLVSTFYVAVDISVPVIPGVDLLRLQKWKFDQLDVNEGFLECVKPSTTTSSGLKRISVNVVNTIATMLQQRSESLV